MLQLNQGNLWLLLDAVHSADGTVKGSIAANLSP
jgi:hypothetical protein